MIITTHTLHQQQTSLFIIIHDKREEQGWNYSGEDAKGTKNSGIQGHDLARWDLLLKIPSFQRQEMV